MLHAFSFDQKNRSASKPSLTTYSEKNQIHFHFYSIQIQTVVNNNLYCIVHSTQRTYTVQPNQNKFCFLTLGVRNSGDRCSSLLKHVCTVLSHNRCFITGSLITINDNRISLNRLQLSPSLFSCRVNFSLISLLPFHLGFYYATCNGEEGFLCCATTLVFQSATSSCCCCCCCCCCC